MPELAVTAIGRDRPGIVASVTGALLDLGGNVEDSQMSILGGHFAVMLLVAVPADTQREQVVERLAEVAQEHELEAISVAEVSEEAREARASLPRPLGVRSRPPGNRPRRLLGARRGRGEHHGPRDQADRARARRPST